MQALGFQISPPPVTPIRYTLNAQQLNELIESQLEAYGYHITTAHRAQVNAAYQSGLSQSSEAPTTTRPETTTPPPSNPILLRPIDPSGSMGHISTSQSHPQPASTPNTQDSVRNNALRDPNNSPYLLTSPPRNHSRKPVGSAAKRFAIAITRALESPGFTLLVMLLLVALAISLFIPLLVGARFADSGNNFCELFQNFVECSHILGSYAAFVAIPGLFLLTQLILVLFRKEPVWSLLSWYHPMLQNGNAYELVTVPDGYQDSLAANSASRAGVDIEQQRGQSGISTSHLPTSHRIRGETTVSTPNQSESRTYLSQTTPSFSNLRWVISALSNLLVFLIITANLTVQIIFLAFQTSNSLTCKSCFSSSFMHSSAIVTIILSLYALYNIAISGICAVLFQNDVPLALSLLSPLLRPTTAPAIHSMEATDMYSERFGLNPAPSVQGDLERQLATVVVNNDIANVDDEQIIQSLQHYAKVARSIEELTIANTFISLPCGDFFVFDQKYPNVPCCPIAVIIDRPDNDSVTPPPPDPAIDAAASPPDPRSPFSTHQPRDNNTSSQSTTTNNNPALQSPLSTVPQLRSADAVNNGTISPSTTIAENPPNTPSPPTLPLNELSNPDNVPTTAQPATTATTTTATETAPATTTTAPATTTTATAPATTATAPATTATATATAPATVPVPPVAPNGRLPQQGQFKLMQRVATYRWLYIHLTTPPIHYVRTLMNNKLVINHSQFPNRSQIDVVDPQVGVEILRPHSMIWLYRVKRYAPIVQIPPNNDNQCSALDVNNTTTHTVKPDDQGHIETLSYSSPSARSMSIRTPGSSAPNRIVQQPDPQCGHHRISSTVTASSIASTAPSSTADLPNLPEPNVDLFSPVNPIANVAGGTMTSPLNSTSNRSITNQTNPILPSPARRNRVAITPSQNRVFSHSPNAGLDDEEEEVCLICQLSLWPDQYENEPEQWNEISNRPVKTMVLKKATIRKVTAKLPLITESTRTPNTTLTTSAYQNLPNANAPKLAPIIHDDDDLVEFEEKMEIPDITFGEVVSLCASNGHFKAHSVCAEQYLWHCAIQQTSVRCSVCRLSIPLSVQAVNSVGNALPKIEEIRKLVSSNNIPLYYRP